MDVSTTYLHTSLFSSPTAPPYRLVSNNVTSNGAHHADKLFLKSFNASAPSGAPSGLSLWSIAVSNAAASSTISTRRE
jgi:hypothetical protein